MQSNANKIDIYTSYFKWIVCLQALVISRGELRRFSYQFIHKFKLLFISSVLATTMNSRTLRVKRWYNTHIIKEQVWGNVRFLMCAVCTFEMHIVCTCKMQQRTLSSNFSVTSFCKKCSGNSTEIQNKLLLLLQHYYRNTHNT